MPPLKSPPIKPGKSMLFFHIWNVNFSVTSINSQMYMTKPKQAQKKLFPNYAPFYPKSYDKTLPEAQWTQGIASKTGVISPAKWNATCIG